MHVAVHLAVDLAVILAVNLAVGLAVDMNAYVCVHAPAPGYAVDVNVAWCAIV